MKEKQGERREMPGVCNICVKHMVGREGHVDSCVCMHEGVREEKMLFHT